MAFTPYAAGAAVVAAALALGLRRRGPAVLAAAAAAVLVAGIVPRAVGSPAGEGGRTIRVLTANVAVDAVPPGRLVALVRRHRPDVLSVQELTPPYARRLAAAGLDRALPHAVLEARPSYAGTGLWARFGLRRLPPIQTGFTMARAQGRGLELVAVHPPAPLRPSALDDWRSGLRALPPAAAAPTRLLAGDFNATLDHAALRDLIDSGYVDAADATGAGLRPTWPNGRWRLPPVTIDHVLVPRRCGVRDYRVLGLARSDHSAVLVEAACPDA